MTREQMIDVLEDYCNGNICDSCEFCNDCEKGMVFSEIVDEKLKDYVSRIDEKNTDKGYKVELTKDNVVSDTVVNIYKEVEMKE